MHVLCNQEITQKLLQYLFPWLLHVEQCVSMVNKENNYYFLRQHTWFMVESVDFIEIIQTMLFWVLGTCDCLFLTELYASEEKMRYTIKHLLKESHHL